MSTGSVAEKPGGPEIRTSSSRDYRHGSPNRRLTSGGPTPAEGRLEALPPPTSAAPVAANPAPLQRKYCLQPLPQAEQRGAATSTFSTLVAPVPVLYVNQRSTARGGPATSSHPSTHQEEGQGKRSESLSEESAPFTPKYGTRSVPVTEEEKARQDTKGASKTKGKAAIRNADSRTFSHTKSRVEMQSDFDRRSREHHRNFLRLCGRLTNKKKKEPDVGVLGLAPNSTINGAQYTRFNPNSTMDRKNSDPFSGMLGKGKGARPLAELLKELPISEETIGNANRDEEKHYATAILPLVEHAAKDEDGDPMVFGLGTIGLAVRERERQRRETSSASGVGPTSSPAQLHQVKKPAKPRDERATPEVFQRLVQAQAPTSKSCNLARRGLMFQNGEQVKEEKPLTVSEFMSLQHLVKFGLPFPAALEAVKKSSQEMEAQRNGDEATLRQQALENARSPTCPSKVCFAPSTNCDNSPEEGDGGVTLPAATILSPAVMPPPAMKKNPGTALPTLDPGLALSNKESDAAQLLTPVEGGSNALKSSVPSPPPPPPPPVGGVMDTFGYFSTHRVQPLYYHQLEGSTSSLGSTNGGGTGVGPSLSGRKGSEDLGGRTIRSHHSRGRSVDSFSLTGGSPTGDSPRVGSGKKPGKNSAIRSSRYGSVCSSTSSTATPKKRHSHAINRND